MNFNKFAYTTVAILAIFSLTACHPRAKPVSKLDEQMSCDALMQEIKSAENMKGKIESNRGVSGRNAVGLLFWPSIVINEVTGESAEKEANQRIAALEDIYAKNCSKECAKKKS